MEKECERIDNNENNSDSELSDEYDDSLRDEAMLEKEKVSFSVYILKILNNSFVLGE